MTHPIGSVPYIRDLQAKKLRRLADRAQEISDLADANYEGWDAMTPEEKDVASKQAQRGISELAAMVAPLTRYLLYELSRENGT